MTVLIRIAGATRSPEDFKYVFYTYLTRTQYGYNLALSYAQDRVETIQIQNYV